VPGPLAARFAYALQSAWYRRGPLACSLWPASRLFEALVRLRRAGYQRGLFTTQRLPVPVIVVGNLIVGGAGKTPVVLALAALLQRRGYTPGIVARGHGGSVGRGVLNVEPDTPAATCGDEPKLLRLRSGAPVVVGRARPAAARALLQAHPRVNVILSDDGLQHLALGRDVQVIVFDARGAGNGWLLPAGPLREPLAQRPPARSLVLYNAAMASTAWPGTCIRPTLSGAVELSSWTRGEPGTREALKRLRGRRMVAAAGIANPQRFFSMLREHGLELDSLELPDHWPFDNLPWPATTADVIVTEKDAVKIDPARLGSTRVWVATLDLQLGAEFETALLALLPAPRATK
jgi:tetraacyldisaccharide 4'-kinase